MRRFFGKILVNTLLLGGAALFLSEYEKNNLRLVSYQISDRRIQKTRNFVFLSDMHDKEFGQNNHVMVEMIKKVQPDAVLIGGDMPCTKDSVSLEATLRLCEALCHFFPVYYANGNHELRMQKARYGGTFARFQRALEDLGVHYLSDRGERFSEDIALYGLDIEERFYQKLRFDRMDAAYIRERLGEPDSASYNILLAHSPNFFEAYQGWGANLSLAGHFHGGTIRLPGDVGLMTPQLQFFNRNVSGIKSRGEAKMIVSAGLGTHSVNLRIGNYPQLVSLRLSPRV